MYVLMVHMLDYTLLYLVLSIIAMHINFSISPNCGGEWPGYRYELLCIIRDGVASYFVKVTRYLLHTITCNKK